MSFFCQMINTRWYYEIYILLIKISRALFFLFSSFKNRVNSWIQILSHFLYFFARKNQIQWRKVMIPYCNIIVSIYSLDCKKLYSHERNLLFIFYIIISSYEVPINAAPKYHANICFSHFLWKDNIFIGGISVAPIITLSYFYLFSLSLDTK